MRRRRLVPLSLCIAASFCLVDAAHARPSYFAAFTSRYPGATELATCGTCHIDFNGGGARNTFGVAFFAAGGPTDPAAALTAIEPGDADGDGTANLTEIVTETGFFPGWSCANYLEAVNAPGDLSEFVDPQVPGCGDVTTTTSILVTTTSTTLSTTTSSTTSTTLLSDLRCAQPVSTGPSPVATDCLFILSVSVGSTACEPAPCVCDPTGDGQVVATDALLCLNAAVGSPATLDCPCNVANLRDSQIRQRLTIPLADGS